MEEKKVIKISLSTFLLILAIILITVMAFFIFKLSNEITETNEKIRTGFSNYLELYCGLHSDMLLQTLNKKGKLNYDTTANCEMLNDGTQVTNIKFSDYKNAMLNYVSESEFEKEWNCYGTNKEGYITKQQGGGGGMIYTINEINKIDDLTYRAKTKYSLPASDDNNSQDFTFTVKSYNGNCVIDTIKTVE